MDIGKPNSDDVSDVQLNQVASNAGAVSPSPQASSNPTSPPPTIPNPVPPEPVQPPSAIVPPSPPSQSPATAPVAPTPVTPPENVAPPTPAPDLGPPSASEPDFGVGRPNIGVELEDKKTPTISEPAPENPEPPKEAPPSPAPMQTDSSVNIKAVGAPPPTSAPSYDVPINKYSDKVSDTPQAPPAANAVPLNPNLANMAGAPSKTRSPQPPIKAPGSAAGTITILAILALIVGGFGGFLGFRYVDRVKTSASTVNTSPSADIGQTATTGKEKSYASTKYGFSLEYPSNWFSSTSDNQADQIVLASNQESLTAKATGDKVSIVFQDSNGKELKDWVEANAAATSETKPSKAITVDGKTAYQQELSNNGQAVATYIKTGEKIMILTYTAPTEMMAAGGDIYNLIINSLKLT